MLKLMPGKLYKINPHQKFHNFRLNGQTRILRPSIYDPLEFGGSWSKKFYLSNNYSDFLTEEEIKENEVFLLVEHLTWNGKLYQEIKSYADFAHQNIFENVALIKIICKNIIGITSIYLDCLTEEKEL